MATGFVILLVVVGVLALAAWPICVGLSRRRPYSAEKLRAGRLREDQRHRTPEQPHGTVLGGSHVGGGRSVSPRRDEEVVPEQGGRGADQHAGNAPLARLRSCASGVARPDPVIGDGRAARRGKRPRRAAAVTPPGG